VPSRRSKIEHRLELIATTTTRAGLSVRSRIDPASYQKGRRISDRELVMVNLHPESFHGEWNDTIHPTEA
jgi:hypothetical protein